MSYTFRVIFEGICAYVPDRPFFVQEANGKWKAGSPTSVQVLIPDLTGRIPRPGTQPLAIAPHFLTLRARVRDLQPETDRHYRLTYRQPGSLDEMALFRVDGEEMKIELDRSSNGDAFSFANWVPKRPQELPDLRSVLMTSSLYWLPRLEEIAPHFDQVDADLLAPNPFPQSLAGRVAIEGGTLRVAGFNRERNGRPRVWRFADPASSQDPGVWNRAIGNRLALEFFDVEGPVRIVLEAPGGAAKQLVLAPPPGTGGDVESIVSNVEPESLFVPEAPLRGFDPDFDVFYDLGLAPKVYPSKPRPTIRPVPNPPPTVFLGVFEKPCSGTGINR